MKKVTLTLPLLCFVLLSFGQKTFKHYDAKSKTWFEKTMLAQTSGAKSFTATISPQHGYVADTTAILHFSLMYESPDYENCDSLVLTFPEGMVPVDGNNPFAESIISFYDEALNGVEGNSISWGDNDNQWGGIEPGTYDFWVEVEVASSVEGTKTIEFYMSGDQSGSSPHEYSGSFTIDPIPDVPDLVVEATGFVREYFSVPLDQVKQFSQVSSTVQINITNLGATLNEPTKATAKSSSTYKDTIDIALPLAALEEKTVSFKSFTTSELGTYNFTFNANASNDYNPENGTATASIEVHKTDLIRDNGEINGSIGIGTLGHGYLGQVFTINNTDTLNSVKVFTGDVTNGDLLRVDVFEMNDDGVPKSTPFATSIEFLIRGQQMEYTAYFSGQGVILEPGNYLFAVREDVNLVSVATTSTDYTDGTAWMFLSDQWEELSNTIFYIRPGFGTESPEFDIELFSLDTYKYALAGDELTITGSLINHGVEPLTAFDITYTVNGGEPVSQSFTNLSENYLYEFKLSTPVVLSEVGDYNLVVKISNINGAEDANGLNNSKKLLLSALEYAPAKSVLAEEATSTWDGSCPKGHVYMEYMAEKYPDSWIGVAVHNYDPMEVTEYTQGIGNYIAYNYPKALLDRMSAFAPEQFEEGYKALVALPSPVDMAIKNVELVGKQLTFDVAAKFLGTVKGARFNAVIKENGVTGTSSGYDQSNYYSGGDFEMGGYEDLPNPVPAIDMVYDDVARAILGGWNGTAGSIYSTAGIGDSIGYTYKVNLESAWNTSEIEIIGMVINADGSILNSTKATLSSLISVVDKSFGSLAVYPNPFNQTITVENLENSTQITISNVLGQTVLAIPVTNASMVINTSNLEKGIYIITANNGNKVCTNRIVKQ